VAVAGDVDIRIANAGAGVVGEAVTVHVAAVVGVSWVDALVYTQSSFKRNEETASSQCCVS
jgi:hypothetical protein